jgi:hypothetical protein
MPSGTTPAASVKNRADRKQGSLKAQLQNSALLFPCTIVSTVLALAAGGQDTRVARAGRARQRTRIAVCSCVPRRAGRRTFCPCHPRLCSVLALSFLPLSVAAKAVFQIFTNAKKPFFSLELGNRETYPGEDNFLQTAILSHDTRNA